MNRAASTELSIICEGYGPRRFFRLPRIGPNVPDAAEMRAWVRAHRLSEDERAILDLFAERRSVADIATLLEMEPRLVANHLEQIRAKFDEAMPSEAAV